jgi:hypothetical protein
MYTCICVGKKGRNKEGYLATSNVVVATMGAQLREAEERQKKSK